MGQWGVKSYENDDAGDALDAGFAQVHGDVYDNLMDDGNPLTPEQIQEQLANPATLLASLRSLTTEVDQPIGEWDEVARLAYAGIVVRFAELKVSVPADLREQASLFLREETIEWEEATARKLRRDKELRLLDSLKSHQSNTHQGA